MEITAIISKLADIYQGKPWHGQSTRSLLETIPETYYLMPVGPGNKSIAHLLEHMIAWQQFAIEKLKNNQGFDIAINTAADWPPPSPIGDPKQHYLNKLDQAQRELGALLKTKDDKWLEERTSNKSYTNKFLVEGIWEHDLYHSGQIALFHAQLKARE